MEVEALCKLEASVPTGLEDGAAEECAEVLGRVPDSSRGRLSVQLRALDELVAVSRTWPLVASYCELYASQGGRLEGCGQYLAGCGGISRLLQRRGSLCCRRLFTAYNLHSLSRGQYWSACRLTLRTRTFPSGRPA